MLLVALSTSAEGLAVRSALKPTSYQPTSSSRWKKRCGCLLGSSRRRTFFSTRLEASVLLGAEAPQQTPQHRLPSSDEGEQAFLSRSWVDQVCGHS